MLSFRYEYAPARDANGGEGGLLRYVRRTNHYWSSIPDTLCYWRNNRDSRSRFFHSDTIGFGNIIRSHLDDLSPRKKDPRRTE
jgi:hypothetical protein